MTKAGTRHSKKAKKGGWLMKVAFVGILLCLVVGYIGYRKLYKPNVHVEQAEGQKYLYIHTGASFEQVLSMLDQCNCLCDMKSFEWMAVKMNYPNHIKPGKYLMKDGMSNRELLTMLRSGKQTPVKVIFHNIRFKYELAGDVSRQIEADSVSLLHFMNDDSSLHNYGFNSKTITAMFIPNTYELYWNTQVEPFMERMHKEYKKFWTDSKKQKAKSIGLNPVEVSTLASIVEEETQKNDEKPAIAGVYINRLKRGMRLQADPTVRFAYGDFSIKRILDKYKEIDSPYNTYMYEGLPPGPICIPSISSINAVLNYQQHEYLYFCAKEDFSGYHNFARTLEQHNINAARYQKALSRAGILR
ncbi:MAG TPA: endolytic transglycosylase MltG [Bacteroidales bacterium]